MGVGPGFYHFWKWWTSLSPEEQWAYIWRVVRGNTGMAVPNIDPVPPDFKIEPLDPPVAYSAGGQNGGHAFGISPLINESATAQMIQSYQALPTAGHENALGIFQTAPSALLEPAMRETE